MLAYLLTYGSTLVTICVLDYLRLGIVMQSHIQQRLGHLMRTPISRGPAIAFYILYSVCIFVLVIYPQSKLGSSMLTVSCYGALFGFAAYMTYDLTNRATLRDRPVAMVIPDIVWGVVVTAIATSVGYLVWIKMYSY